MTDNDIIMNIKKTTKQELLSIIEEQNYRIERHKSDYRMITADLQESNRKVLTLKEELKERSNQIRNLQLDIVTELKAVRYMIEVSGSGLTHNEKAHLTEVNINILDHKIDDLMESIDFNMKGSDMPF